MRGSAQKISVGRRLMGSLTSYYAVVMLHEPPSMLCAVNLSIVHNFNYTWWQRLLAACHYPFSPSSLLTAPKFCWTRQCTHFTNRISQFLPRLFMWLNSFQWHGRSYLLGTLRKFLKWRLAQLVVSLLFIPLLPPSYQEQWRDGWSCSNNYIVTMK